MTFLQRNRKWFVLPLVGLLAAAAGGGATLAGCGPFSDVSGGQCPFILSLYYLGIAAGTSATTFDPNANVTRGQVAVFLGAGIKYIKRTENPFRVASKNNGNVFNFEYEDYSTPNTSSPNGFCTDGLYNYVANEGTSKIDVFSNGSGNGSVGSYTTTSGNRRLVCDGTYLYATGTNGTVVKRINTHTGVVNDPWATLAGASAGDIANAGFALAVATNTGITILGKGNVPVQTPVALPGGVRTHSVVVDASGNFWADSGPALYKIGPNGTVLGNVPLNGAADFYAVYDGAAIWVPLVSGGGIDIVSTGGVLIDHLAPAGGAATTRNAGGVFTGQYVMFAETGDYQSCGTPETLITAYDPTTHGGLQGILTFCNDGTTFTLGFDGRFVHVLTFGGNHHYIF